MRSLLSSWTEGTLTITCQIKMHNVTLHVALIINSYFINYFIHISVSHFHFFTIHSALTKKNRMDFPLTRGRGFWGVRNTAKTLEELYVCNLTGLFPISNVGVGMHPSQDVMKKGTDRQELRRRNHHLNMGLKPHETEGLIGYDNPKCNMR